MPSRIIHIVCIFLIAVAAEMSAAEPYITSTDYGSVGAAVAAARSQGCKKVFIPAGTYYIPAQGINLTNISGDDGFEIVGSGFSTILIGRVYARPVFDLSGSSNVHISSLSIYGDQTVSTPAVGILMGSTTTSISYGNTLRAVYIDNYFSVACVYIAGSRENRFYDCAFTNRRANGRAVIISPANRYGVLSQYTTLAMPLDVGQYIFESCVIRTAAATDAMFISDSTGMGAGVLKNIRILNCGFSCKTNPTSAAFLFDGSDLNSGGIANVEMRNNQFETWGTDYGVLGKGKVNTLELCGNYIATSRFDINNSAAIRYQSYGASARNWKVVNNTYILHNETGIANTYGGKYIYDFDNLSNSELDVTKLGFEGIPAAKQGYTAMVHLGQSAGNTIKVDGRLANLGNPSYLFDTNPVRTVVDVLADPNEQAGAVRRQYVGIGGGKTLMNLTPRSVSQITSPQTGDVAMDDGTNTASGKKALAYYNGTAWVFLEGMP